MFPGPRKVQKIFDSKKDTVTLLCFNRAIGIFSSFVKIQGAGPKPKHAHMNSYKFPSQ